MRAALAAAAALAICATASASSTHLVWTARLSAPVGTPAVADGHIYVATGAKHTRLHALDATTGRRQWSSIGGLGTLYAPLAAPGLLVRLSNADTVRRYDPATGRIFWRRDHPYSEGFLAQPLLADGRVFELSDSLVALDARTGAILWRADDDCFRCQVSSDGMRVYAAGKQGLRAFDAATGKIVWTAPGVASLDPVASTTVSDGVVAVLSSSVSGKTWTFYLEGYRASDGRRLWHTKLADSDGFDPFTAPVSGDGLVLFPATDGNLYALDLHSGAIQWRANVGATDSTPAFGRDQIWIVDGGNRLRALRPATGVTQWTGPPMKAVKGVPSPSPVLDGSLVLVGTAAGNLLAFSAD
jgi:outer membrane protein assembly factor BamB